MEKKSVWADYVTLVLGLLGFAFGAVLICWDYKATAESARFTSSPQFALWLILIAGQLALWSAFVLPLALSLRWGEANRAVMLKLAALIALMLLAALSGVGRPAATPLAHHAAKMLFINVFGAAVASVAMLGIWLTQAALERMEAELGGEQQSDQTGKVKKFLGLRASLERYLMAAGVMVGAATLSTGALRNATLAYDKSVPFPPEHVLIYGLLSSGLLALVYAPAHSRLVSVRSRLRDALAPLPDARPASWSDWHSERKAVDEILLVQSGVASFAGGVSILTPLLGSLIPLLIGMDN